MRTARYRRAGRVMRSRSAPVAFSPDGMLLAAAGGLRREGESRSGNVESARRYGRSKGIPIAFTLSRFRRMARRWPRRATTSSSSFGMWRRERDSHAQGPIDASTIWRSRRTEGGSLGRGGSATIRGLGYGGPVRRLYTRDPLTGEQIAIHRRARWWRRAGRQDDTHLVARRESGELKNSLIAHEDAILRLAYSPTGRFLFRARR